MTQGKQPIYSYCGTSIHIPASEEMAAAYNRFVDELATAMKRFEASHERIWESKDQFSLDVTDEEIKAYNTVADIINAMVDLCGGAIDITEDDMPTNHLELIK